MFNSSLRKESIEKFEDEVAVLKKKREIMKKRSSTLQEIREKLFSTIKCTENYINTLKNTPENFKVDIKEIKKDVDNYEDMLEELEKKVRDVQIRTGSRLIGGAAGPAIAAAFGSESKGATISSSALARLGEASETMSDSFVTALLGGAVGWLVVAGPGLFMNGKNKKIAEEAMEKTKEVVKENKVLELINYEIKEMISYTRENNKNIEFRLELTEAYPTDYLEMNEEQRYMLGTLLNLVKSSVVSLDAYIGDDNKFKIKKKTTRDTDFFASI